MQYPVRRQQHPIDANRTPTQNHPMPCSCKTLPKRDDYPIQLGSHTLLDKKTLWQCRV